MVKLEDTFVKVVQVMLFYPHVSAALTAMLRSKSSAAFLLGHTEAELQSLESQ